MKRRRTRGMLPAAAMALTTLLAGCGEPQPPALMEVEVRTLPPVEAVTLALDDSGRVWLGRPGRMTVVDGTEVDRVHPTPSAEPPRVIARLGGRVYLSAGDSLRVVPRPDSLGTRGDMRRAVLAADPRGRFLLQGAHSGAVLGHDVATLAPLWGWGAIAAVTTGLAPSPLGDRLYQAILAEGDGPRLLVRDLQTGRILGSHPLSAATTSLVAAPSGRLYGLERDGGRMVVVGLDPSGGGVAELWRHRVAAEDSGVASLAVAGTRVVVWGAGVRWGLVTLDAETGEVLLRAREVPIDAAVDPAGAIWALYPGELRRLE